MLFAIFIENDKPVEKYFEIDPRFRQSLRVVRYFEIMYLATLDNRITPNLSNFGAIKSSMRLMSFLLV